MGSVMLEQVLRNLNNFFFRELYEGDFTIRDGSITLPFLLEGQYFRVCGSILNDGVYQYPASGLQDEEFHGTIWALAVPPAVVELATDIEKWQAKNGEAAVSPYTSESFGGYSYTRATSYGGSASGTGWQAAFSARLNEWRKMKGVEP